VYNRRVKADDQTLRGVAHFNAGRFSLAIRCFRRAVAAGDRDPLTRCFMAHALDSSGRPREAVQALSAVIEEHPSCEPASSALAAIVLRSLGPDRLARSARFLKAAMALQPGNRRMREEIVKILRAHGQSEVSAGRWAKAEEVLRLALEIGPNDVASLRWCGQACASAGRWAPAEAALRRALALEPGAPIRRELVEVLRERARTDRPAMAEKTLRRALMLAPGDGRLRAELVRSLRERARAGRPAAAEATLRRALSLAPADEETRRGLAEVLRARGRAARRPAAAAKALDAALKLETGLARGRGEIAAALLAGGTGYHSAGLLGSAETALRRASKLAPGDRRVRRALLETLQARGRAFHAGGRLAAAEKALREALALEPRDAGSRRDLADVLRARAWACQSAGRLEQAEAFLRQALAFNSVHADFLRRLARALRARRNADPAEGGEGSLETLRSREQICRITGRLRAREALLKRILELTPDLSVDRFKTLMNLRRYDEAFDLAELMLDEKPSLTAVWGFANPWDWEDWTSRDGRKRQLVRDLERHAATRARRPWLYYYRVALSGPGGLAEFDRMASYPLARYGWMYLMAGRMCLIDGRVSKAVEWLTLASSQEPIDWRARALLAEAHLVLHRPEAARAEMDRAAAVVPPHDEGLLLAWRGALDLWTGDYETALERLERACVMGAPHAFCWRAAALLKLGRTAEALEKLNEVIRRFPGDLEAYIWRAEARRALGLHEEALEDLRQSPPGVWSMVNRALTKAALHDHEGMKADYAALPKDVVDFVAAKLKLDPAGASGTARMNLVLEEALTLSRGWRREEYGQSLWMW
jgi:tetratricopeptide (TPR) repeat protein